MKNAVYYKDGWLMPNSLAYELFHAWKKLSDPKQQQVARKKFEVHIHDVNARYNKLCGI
jgi:hypothetical protein